MRDDHATFRCGFQRLSQAEVQHLHGPVLAHRSASSSGIRPLAMRVAGLRDMVAGAEGLYAQPLACPNKHLIPDPGPLPHSEPETRRSRGETQAVARRVCWPTFRNAPVHVIVGIVETSQDVSLDRPGDATIYLSADTQVQTAGTLLGRTRLPPKGARTTRSCPVCSPLPTLGGLRPSGFRLRRPAVFGGAVDRRQLQRPGGRERRLLRLVRGPCDEEICPSGEAVGV